MGEGTWSPCLPPSFYTGCPQWENQTAGMFLQWNVAGGCNVWEEEQAGTKWGSLTSTQGQGAKGRNVDRLLLGKMLGLLGGEAVPGALGEVCVGMKNLSVLASDGRNDTTPVKKLIPQNIHKCLHLRFVLCPARYLVFLHTIYLSIGRKTQKFDSSSW